MKILDVISPNTALLTEANILNVKDPHDGHSIQKYLNHYAKSIGSDVAKKMFIKKLQKLLLNDPKYHFAVRELPDDAPDWAQQALADRDLFYFKANPDLNNTIEHLTHYIAKMEEDMDSADSNTKAVATKEFAGFAKAESLDVLQKKSNAYFERGGSKEASFEGTKEILKTGEFRWLKLQTSDAFRHAGATLHNCIGSHWTKAKTDNAGESIIVLVDGKGQMIVAARIKNKENELQEMKGKNNQPPIKAYMSPVAAMINKFKLSLSSGAHRDVINTGYYFDEDSRMLLTKPQALKKLVSFDVIGDIGYGLKLVQPKPTNDTEAARRIFSELYTDSSWRWHSGMGDDKIFEGRADNGNPVISAIVDDGELTTLKMYFNERLHDESHLQEALDMSKKKDYVKSFVTELIQRNLVNNIARDIERHVFWELNLEWDKENKRLVDRVKGEQTQLDKKDHKWTKYTDESTLNTIQRMLGGSEFKNMALPVKKIFIATEEVADDRSRNETDIHLAVLVDDENVGHLVNVSGKGTSQDHIGYKKEANNYGHLSRVAPDPKSVRSIIALAKKEHFKLQTPAKARFGVTGENPDQYDKHETDWEKIPGDPEAVKADFSKLRDEDRFTAVYHTAMMELGGAKTTDLFGLHDKLQGNDDFIYSENNINHADQFKGHDSKSAYKAIGSVDAIYKVDVGFGTGSSRHGALVMVANNKIVKLDTTTEKHNWQGWDDFDKVVEQLNKFADEQHLTFATDAVTTDKRARTEFRVDGGKLTTMTSVKNAELSRKKKKEGVDSLEYSDGWTLHRMTPDEQAKWIRRGMKEGVRGQAWLLEDDDKNKRAVFTILHQRVARMFYHRTNVLTKEWPTQYGSQNSRFLPYLKTAMDQFKWKGAKTGTMKDENIDPATIQHLEAMNKIADPDRPGPMPGSQYVLQQLARDGLLDSLSARRWKINEKGKAVLAEYTRLKTENPRASVTKMDLMKGIDPHADFSIPDPNARPTRQANAGAAATNARPTQQANDNDDAEVDENGRPITKATRALNKFRAHVDENGRIPTRGEFMAWMEEAPFNMSKNGAQTYYYTTKKKYANLNESVLGSLAQLLLVEPDALYSSFADMVID